MKVPDNIAENLEQSQETVEPPHVAKAKDLTRVNKLSADLIAELEKVPDGDMVGEIIANALKLLRDQTNRGDIKLINKSFKELRYALKVFAPYRDVRKVSIFGSARTPESARRLPAGRRLRQGDGGGGVDGHHRRRRRDHGGRPRRRGGRAVLRPGHPPAVRAGAPTRSSPTTRSSSTSSTSSPAS